MINNENLNLMDNSIDNKQFFLYFNNKLNVCTNEYLILKKIKKRRVNYLFSHIKDKFLKRFTFKEMINIFSRFELDKNFESINLDSEEKILFKNYFIWFFINLNYFRCNYLTNKEYYFKNYYKNNVIDIISNMVNKRPDNSILNLFPKNKNNLKNSNELLSSINLFHKVNDNEFIKNINLDNTIKKLSSIKNNYNIKIFEKLSFLVSHYNNINEEKNIECEYELNFNRIRMNEKFSFEMKCNKLEIQIKKNINNNLFLILNENFIDERKLICDICLQTNYNEKNYLIFCDGCNTPVHRDCYKINIEVGNIKNWYCDVCKIIFFKNIENFEIKCFICNNYGGIMKLTNFNKNEKKWVHMNCIYWLDHKLINNLNCLYLNNNFKEFIFKDDCMICKKKNGFKLKCIENNCNKVFHSYCQSKILSNIDSIKFEVDDSIFYRCFDHSKDIIWNFNCLNYEVLLRKFKDFYYKIKKLTKDEEEEISFKFILKKSNNKIFLINI